MLLALSSNQLEESDAELRPFCARERACGTGLASIRTQPMFFENPAHISAVQLGMVKSDMQEGASVISVLHQQVEYVCIGGEFENLLNLTS